MWFVDGTFKVVSIIFFQLFAVLASFGQVNNGIERKLALPVAYALMENKTQIAYEKVFEVLKEECNRNEYRLSVRTIMTDFELAIINAVATIGVDVKSCFFHMKQAIFRRIQADGLQQDYNNPQDRSIKEAAQMMCATAFVPVNDVEEAFEIFLDASPDDFVEVAENCLLSMLVK